MNGGHQCGDWWGFHSDSHPFSFQWNYIYFCNDFIDVWDYIGQEPQLWGMRKECPLSSQLWNPSYILKGKITRTYLYLFVYWCMHWGSRCTLSIYLLILNLIKPSWIFCRYILIYPQGCDVCNHLSLFLCVANHDKLLPGNAYIVSSFNYSRLSTSMHLFLFYLLFIIFLGQILSSPC